MRKYFPAGPRSRSAVGEILVRLIWTKTFYWWKLPFWRDLLKLFPCLGWIIFLIWTAPKLENNRKLFSYEQPLNNNIILSKGWTRSCSGGEIFSHMNSFSRLSEIIFSYEAGAKKVLRNHLINCKNSSLIILYTKNFKQLFFALMLVKKT